MFTGKIEKIKKCKKWTKTNPETKEKQAVPLPEGATRSTLPPETI